MTRTIILGGTGTLGVALTRELVLNRNVPVTIFSRGEHKQKQMAEEFHHDSRISFILGDIRDRTHLDDVLTGYTTCFHVAALKHVDMGESNPEEFVKTDVIGTMNVASSAIRNGLDNVIFSSTDKAVDAINAYGACKFLSEKILFSQNARQSKTKFSVFRWGNIVGSQGSVIHALINSLALNGTYPLTHPDMTRFLLRIEDAVKFMLDNYPIAPLDRVLIPSFKSAKVTDLADVVANFVGYRSAQPHIVGIRPGEKMHEVLSSAHTPMPQMSSKDNLMSREELITLVAPVLEAI